VYHSRERQGEYTNVRAGKSSKHRVGGVLQIAAVIGYGSGQYKNYPESFR